MQVGAAFLSVRNLVKTNDLLASKMKQSLHSKTSYTKFLSGPTSIQENEGIC